MAVGASDSARRLDRLEALRETLAQKPSCAASTWCNLTPRRFIEHFSTSLAALTWCHQRRYRAQRSSPLGQMSRRCRLNVLGFMAVAQWRCVTFSSEAAGTWSGSHRLRAARQSAAALRGFEAFQSVYLMAFGCGATQRTADRSSLKSHRDGVDNCHAEPDRPLPALVSGSSVVVLLKRRARQILRAFQQRKKHTYHTRRYGPVAFILKLLPRPGLGSSSVGDYVALIPLFHRVAMQRHPCLVHRQDVLGA